MTSHLHRDLQGLEKHLLYLAATVEEGVRKSIAALQERRPELAEQVIAGDDDIDRMEVELEEECLKILALHQPVAFDLRFIACCLKINSDLERIGDLSANIAERALSLGGGEPMDVPAGFRQMLDVVTEMLRESIDSFVQGDARRARGVLTRDDLVDRDNREVIERLLIRMHEEPAKLDRYLELISVSKNLERIADHATNIAEDVVYLVEGEIIRHRG